MHPSIPSIDFSAFHGSVHDRQQIASEIDNALSTIGFFYLTNHGLEQHKIDACFEWSKRFFNLSEREKERFSPVAGLFDHGYSGVGREKVRGQACMKECFDVGHLQDDVPDTWTEEELLRAFLGFFPDFYQGCVELIDKLLQCLSIALDVGPEQSFGQYHTGSLYVASLIHYPTVSAQLLRSRQVVRCPAHSDFGTLTLLFQQNVGGLEIADMSSTDKTNTADVERSGQFVHAEPKPGAILVNVGYLLMRWTNGRWKNTVHRVSEPPRTVENEIGEEIDDSEEVIERYSIAFFGFPDAPTIVEPLPTCCSDEKPKRWGPINAGEYLLKKRAVIYS